MTDKWLKFIKDNKIPISSGINAIDVLVNDATIAEWNNQLLPSDQTSIENGCILTNCERWPLIIDPQLQVFTLFTQSHTIIGYHLDKEEI